MKFYENYREGPWAALALTPETRDELVKRLISGDEDIIVEDLFARGSYKI